MSSTVTDTDFDEIEEPSVLSSDPNERKLARRLRIQRRQEALQKYVLNFYSTLNSWFLYYSLNFNSCKIERWWRRRRSGRGEPHGEANSRQRWSFGKINRRRKWSGECSFWPATKFKFKLFEKIICTNLDYKRTNSQRRARIRSKKKGKRNPGRVAKATGKKCRWLQR